jgi:hypothetical protein
MSSGFGWRRSYGSFRLSLSVLIRGFQEEEACAELILSSAAFDNSKPNECVGVAFGGANEKRCGH